MFCKIYTAIFEMLLTTIYNKNWLGTVKSIFNTYRNIYHLISEGITLIITTLIYINFDINCCGLFNLVNFVCYLRL